MHQGGCPSLLRTVMALHVTHVQGSAHAGSIWHRARALGPRKDVGFQVVHIRVSEIQAPCLVSGYQVLAALLHARRGSDSYQGQAHGIVWQVRLAHQLYDPVAASLKLHLHGACNHGRVASCRGLALSISQHDGLGASAVPLVEGASVSAATSADVAKHREACDCRCLSLLLLQSRTWPRPCCRAGL